MTPLSGPFRALGAAVAALLMTTLLAAAAPAPVRAAPAESPAAAQGPATTEASAAAEAPAATEGRAAAEGPRITEFPAAAGGAETGGPQITEYPASPGEVAYEIEPVVTPPPPELPIPKADPPAIYLVAPASGPWGIFGADAELGARLGLKSVGDGFELRLLDEEDPRLVADLTASPAPMVAIGHLYEDTLAAAWPWYRRAEAPVVSPFLDQNIAAELGEGFVGLMPAPAEQGLRLAREVPRSGARRPSQVIILQGPEPTDAALAESFREALLNPVAPAPTKSDPKPVKPRALNQKIVMTIPVSSVADLEVLSELKTGAKDLVLLALPARLALRCLPVLAEGQLKRATFLAPIWLATREVGAMFVSAGMPGLQALVPLDLGARNKPNRGLEEVIIRYVRAYRREPTWPAILAYDLARLAAMAASDEAGPAAYLADTAAERSGSSGLYTLAPGGWPSTLAKIDESRLSLLP